MFIQLSDGLTLNTNCIESVTTQDRNAPGNPALTRPRVATISGEWWHISLDDYNILIDHLEPLLIKPQLTEGDL